MSGQKLLLRQRYLVFERLYSLYAYECLKRSVGE